MQHDASNFETLIRGACNRGKFYADEPLIDTALDAGPKVKTRTGAERMGVCEG